MNTLPNTVQLSLDGPMTIYSAADVKSRLMTSLQGASLVELDLSHVTEMDTAGFQLLIMAKREAQRLEQTLRIVAHSHAVQEVIDFYNMDSFFGDPMILSAER